MATPNQIMTGDLISMNPPSNKSEDFISYIYDTINAFNKASNLIYKQDKVQDRNKLVDSIQQNAHFFYERLGFMKSLGLSLANAEFYIYVQRGGNLVIDTTPKGLNKLIAKISSRSGLTVIPQNYTIRKGDGVDFGTDGYGFDYLSHKPNVQSALAGGNGQGLKDIEGFISHVKIFSNSTMIASKVIIVPKDELTKIWNTSGNIAKAYFSTYMEKTTNKRLLKWLLSILDDKDGALSLLEEDMRQDDDSPSVAPTITPTITPTFTKGEEVKLEGKEVKALFGKIRGDVAVSTMTNGLAKFGLKTEDLKYFDVEELTTILEMVVEGVK